MPNSEKNDLKNIPHIPLNGERYYQALMMPNAILSYKKSPLENGAVEIHLERLHAPQNRPGSGFGTGLFAP